MKNIAELDETTLLDLAMVLYDIQEELDIKPEAKRVKIAPIPLNEYRAARQKADDHTLNQARHKALEYLYAEGYLYDVEVTQIDKIDPAGFIFDEVQSYKVTLNDHGTFDDFCMRIFTLARPILEQHMRTQHKRETSLEPVITAQLTFTRITSPLVRADSKTYRLKPMRDGKPFNIVAYCLEKYPNKTVTLSKLKAELKASGIAVGSFTNISEELRKSVFGIKRPLSPFVVASSQAIMVKPTALLSSDQLKNIATESVEIIETISE